MTTKIKLSPKSFLIYYSIITITFILLLVLLPHGYWNYIPVIYILIGPITFGVLYYHFGAQLNSYTNENHPDLMKKYSIHYGVRKGEVLNQMDVIQNKKEFHNRNDKQLSQLVVLYSQSLKFIAISFASVLFVILRILKMWN